MGSQIAFCGITFDCMIGNLKRVSMTVVAETQERRSAYRHTSRSDREFRIALKDLHFEFRSFALFHESTAGSNPIPQRASICSLTALQWAWDTNELGLERIICDRYDRVAMPAHIDELQVRGKVRVRLLASFFYISSLRIFQARPHAMSQQHVDRGLWLLIVGSLSQIECSKRMVFRETVLQRFYHARR